MTSPNERRADKAFCVAPPSGVAPLSGVADRLVTANAYLGAAAIAAALRAGADIVITGRVADPSLTVGPCVAHFGWSDTDYDRIAGATEVLVGSARRWALVHELRADAEPALATLLRKLAPVDLVIVEGYKRAPHPKLEVHRAAVGKPLLAPADPAIVAIAADVPLLAAIVPVVALDDVDRIVDIMIRHAAPLDAVEAHVGLT